MLNSDGLGRTANTVLNRFAKALLSQSLHTPLLAQLAVERSITQTLLSAADCAG